MRGTTGLGLVLVASLAAAGIVACSSDGSGDAAPPYPDGSDAGADGATAPGTPARNPSRGSAIAVSEDDAVLVVANRGSGSVSVLSLTYEGNAAPRASKVDVDLGRGAEPWQVALAPNGDTAYVVLRQAQAVVEITGLRSTPKVGRRAETGSEPTSIALSPTGAKAYVANWVDGTVSVFGTATMTLEKTIDLNPALVATGALGAVGSRAALAHPRSLVVSNDGDAEDDDETIWATEYFAMRVEAEAADGANADTSKAGLVYRVSAKTGDVGTVRLGPLADVGLPDENGNPAGCFPNQLQSIALAGKYAYVVSVCASPKGPTGPKVTATACTTAADCAGLVAPVCAKVDASSAGTVCIDTASVKTATQPVVSVVDTETGAEVAGAAANLNARWSELYAKTNTPDDASRRYPLVADDLAFVPGAGIGYLSANGADAVFRVRFDAATGALTEVGSPAAAFVDLAPKEAPAASQGKNPIGVAVSATGKGLLFAANDVSRNVSVVDLNLQALAGDKSAPVVFDAAPRPAAGSAEERVLAGKRFFETGTGRWSLKGQGWGACQSCHVDGLTDNVTWYFARGPRQSTSLDGSYSKKDPKDQRVFNWTAIFDEIADFEGNTRGVSGGVGAIVRAKGPPAVTADRINAANAGGTGVSHAGLNGSAALLADTSNPLGLPAGEESVLEDWARIEEYARTIRAPRAPKNLDAAKVAEGRALFTQKNCQGCHGGDKWTVSRVSFTPSPAENAALRTTSWADAATAAGFPASLFPASTPENRLLRFDSGNAAALDQIQCALRPVGTFGLAEPGVGVAELRVNMTAKAQGDEIDGKGYNPPSLLGMATGAPYLHAGNARTLEALLGDTFRAHHQALATNFLDPSDAQATAQRDALVQFVLSVDASAEVVPLPALGPKGGDLCRTP